MDGEAVATFEHMLDLLTGQPDRRVPVRMLVGVGVVDALRAAIPFETRPDPAIHMSSMAGVPIVESDGCVPGEWRMLDQYGDEYASGRVAVFPALAGGWHPSHRVAEPEAGELPPAIRSCSRCHRCVEGFWQGVTEAGAAFCPGYLVGGGGR